MQPCNHEEADNRLFLHTKDISNKCIKKAIIVTVDIDVIIITLYHYFDSNLEKLWFGIGVGKHKRWLSIHQYAKNLKIRLLYYFQLLSSNSKTFSFEFSSQECLNTEILVP